MLSEARLAQVAVTVRELPRAVAFYRDVLGIRHLFDAGPAMSFFDVGGIRLLLGVAEGGEGERRSSILYLQVGDIDRTHADLLERGVRFRGKPHFVAPLGDNDLWMAFFEDTEGNVLAITSEKRRPS